MRRTRIVAAVILMAVVRAASPCLGRPPFENQWGPFTGTVVDAATGQPIPGAVFTVIWMKVIPFPFQGIERFFDARVAVADEHGHFDIPRRSWPFLLLGGVKTPYLSCVAPGYAPFQTVGAQNAPVSATMRALSAEKRRSVWSDDPVLGSIPKAKCSELEGPINQRRQQMRLPAIGFCSGNIEGTP